MVIVIIKTRAREWMVHVHIYNCTIDFGEYLIDFGKLVLIGKQQPKTLVGKAR